MSTVEQRQATLRSISGARHIISVTVTQEPRTKPDSRYINGVRPAGSQWRVDHTVVQFEGRIYLLVTPVLSLTADNIAFHERPVLDLDQTARDWEASRLAARPALRCAPCVPHDGSPDDPARVWVLSRRDTGEVLHRWPDGEPGIDVVGTMCDTLNERFDAEFEAAHPRPVAAAKAA